MSRRRALDWFIRRKPRLKVYATVAEFRNSTGEPGWVAASTKGKTIQMQPPDVLRDAGTLDSTIHHELLHMLIDSYARPGTPLWFREGLVLYLTSPSDASHRRPRRDDLAAWRNRCALRRVKKNCDTLTPKRERASRNWRSSTEKTLYCTGCRTDCRRKRRCNPTRGSALDLTASSGKPPKRFVPAFVRVELAFKASVPLPFPHLSRLYRFLKKSISGRFVSGYDFSRADKPFIFPS